ncbi:MAG: hypothetical protein LC772_06025 [Chloroflexi bacterium]|nr:hypothetical protein [Chloroflexota bacterium]
MLGIGGLISIGAAVWIYNQEDGGEAVVWAILTLLFSMITLIVYGITRRSATAFVFAGAIAALWLVQIVTVLTMHGPR